MLSVYEISSGKAWARFISSDGYVIVRAASFFLNPNLYGLFSALIAIVFSFAWYYGVGKKVLYLLLPGVFLSGFSMFLASSRSFSYLLLAFFVVLCLLLPRGGRRGCKPLFVYSLSLLFFSLLFMLLGLKYDNELVRPYAILSWRMIESPVQIAAGFCKIFGLDQYFGFTFSFLKPETVVALEGRFYGEGRDSGLLTVFDHSGWLGVVAIGSYFMALSYFSAKSYLRERNVMTAYSVAVVLFCFAVGVVIRYQVYPVSIWLGGLLAPCLALWRSQFRSDRKRSVLML